MITRRSFLAASAALPLAAQRSSARPNIVFVFTDDQRWDSMGIAGHPFLKTPNMDRIGREGAYFENNFVTTPLCSPSRASFLTGQYVHTHKVIGNGDNAERSHELKTFPMLLQKAGYETAFMGKMHMGNDPTPRPGWDKWICLPGQGQYIDPKLNIDGKTQVVEGYITDILNKNADEFLRKPRNKPFLLYLPHKAVHGPFTPAERHKDLYANDPIPWAPSTEDHLDGKPMLQRQAGQMPPLKPGGAKNEATVRNQLRCLAAVDEGLGQIFKALEETRQLDNTLFIFSSDNGYIWGEHDLGDKRPAYEESIRIPMLIRYPKMIKAGTRIPQMTLNIDIAPTALDVAGVPIPSSVQGKSMVPLFKGKTSGWRKSFFCEYFAEKNFPRIPSWQGIRTDRWKYVHYTDPALQNMDELYDLKADRYEMKNLINDPAAQSTLKQLKVEFEAQRKATGAD